MTTIDASMTPSAITTPVTRESLRVKPTTSRCWRMLAPRFRARAAMAVAAR
jgi:hypothetical protein